MGEYLNKKGVKSLYVVGPNYAAGKDMIAGVKRTYKGELKGEDYTKWPDQLDFSAELTKVAAAKPDGIFVTAISEYQGGIEVRSKKSFEKQGTPNWQNGPLAGSGPYKYKDGAEGQFLRNPEDPRDKMVFRPTQPNDEFVLKFAKP